MIARKPPRWDWSAAARRLDPGGQRRFEPRILGKLLINRRTQIVLGTPAIVKFLALDFEAHAPISLAIESREGRFAMQQPAYTSDITDGQAARTPPSEHRRKEKAYREIRLRLTRYLLSRILDGIGLGSEGEIDQPGLGDVARRNNAVGPRNYRRRCHDAESKSERTNSARSL